MYLGVLAEFRPQSTVQKEPEKEPENFGRIRRFLVLVQQQTQRTGVC